MERNQQLFGDNKLVNNVPDGFKIKDYMMISYIKQSVTKQCIKKERRALWGVKNDDVNKSDSLNN